VSCLVRKGDYIFWLEEACVKKLVLGPIGNKEISPQTSEISAKKIPVT
jgi:hypothetical protein